MRYPASAVPFLMLVSAVVHPAAAADVAAGKTVFWVCSICHSAEAGKNKVGPSLFGVVGRKSASLPDYDYSAAMRTFDKTWDAVTLDAFLADPRALVPGTKMIYRGLKNAEARANLIGYLATLK
jgi:cytochrome c